MLHLLQLSQLNKLGVDVVCLGNDEDGKQFHIGYGAVSQFFTDRPNILEELHLHHDLGKIMCTCRFNLLSFHGIVFKKHICSLC